MNASVTSMEGVYVIDPLIVRDLDNDGTAEIVLAAANIYFQRRGMAHGNPLHFAKIIRA